MSRVSLSHKLVLNKWLLGLFGVSDFEELARHLRAEDQEGLDENNIHYFHRTLAARFSRSGKLSEQLLLEYDQNIVRHTRTLNEGRHRLGKNPIRWKYFQYLALLFTEIYLDQYFRDPEGLLNALGHEVDAHNEDRPKSEQLEPVDTSANPESELNKVSFWCATGSGKTLLMHVNILQYLYYLDKHGRRGELNRIILLTPNEGLSEQHLREFEASGLPAQMFNKDRQLSMLETSDSHIEVLDIHKLAEDMGEKTVAVGAFEGNNLVLVDEGHRGASSGRGGPWMRFRNALCEEGFSFEYSATFGQAVGKNKGLNDLYAKNILFDYSYPYFHADGFGKDYKILNLTADVSEEGRQLYLTGCLLHFYQQLRLYRSKHRALRPFQVEKPLWVFVGSRVTKGLAAQDRSDIIDIVGFLLRYLTDQQESIERIDTLLSTGLLTADQRNIFADQFDYLNETDLSAERIYRDTLAEIFNAPAGGQLYMDQLKAADGEIALRLGVDSKPFGVINVGDPSRLLKAIRESYEEHGPSAPAPIVNEREFTGSLFHEINEPDSSVNLLIGARKFTEGWSSWRVSTMGLMNVGRTEGAQILQLFGRGVRLKGYQFSLKRSTRTELPPDVQRPDHIELLETLAVFGIRADYMATFRDFLKGEGLPEETLEFFLPIVQTLAPRRLRTLRLKRSIRGMRTDRGGAFRKLGPTPVLNSPPEHLLKHRVTVNWYPKVRAIMPGDEDDAPNSVVALNEDYLTPRHVAFLDIDALFFELERFKSERGWHSLTVTRQAVKDLLLNPQWYRLLIPSAMLQINSLDRLPAWQEIAASLLRKYVERFHSYYKSIWERRHLELADFGKKDPNFPIREKTDDMGYRIIVRHSREKFASMLNKLKTLIESGDLKGTGRTFKFKGLEATWMGPHLYQSLLHFSGDELEITPAPLNDSEWQFIQDLKAFHETEQKKGTEGFFHNKQLYLIRNQSRGRGIGFIEAGNFYPDFIVWLLTEDKQHIIFVDPKGLYYHSIGDDKIQFHKTIKTIQDHLGDDAITLDSYIVTPSRAAEITRQWGVTKEELAENHVFFLNEDKNTYIGTILRSVTGD